MTMRSTFAGLAFGFLTLAAALTPSSTARAEEEYDVKISAGKITVETKGDWHINDKYPWKLTVGDTKLDKSKFAISEKSAVLKDAPKGKGTLKGAVCSGNECKT